MSCCRESDPCGIYCDTENQRIIGYFEAIESNIVDRALDNIKDTLGSREVIGGELDINIPKGDAWGCENECQRAYVSYRFNLIVKEYGIVDFEIIHGKAVTECPWDGCTWDEIGRFFNPFSVFLSIEGVYLYLGSQLSTSK